MNSIQKMKARFWKSYWEAKKENSEKPRYYVVGNGVMTMKASEVMRTKTFREHLDAAERLERHSKTPQ
ncbi:hypothetical protein [Vreelandella venusta]|uniref:hypothetical protein n=1 Tax=Vreelandella venusta TaxID=44935 RepID=UPI003AA7E9D9